MEDVAYQFGKKLLCGNYSQYTPTGKDYFVKAGRFSSTPSVGDIVYFYSNSLKRVAHVGIVVDLRKSAYRYEIRTVEGNTTSGSDFSRNGGCVALKEYSFKISEIGGTNRINGFGHPIFNSGECDIDTFIETAKKELGYMEKETNSDLDSKTANVGDKNFTKYGAWYGGNGLYWCQQFVSWCAYMACKTYQVEKATGWRKFRGNWRYQINGKYVFDRWIKENDRWYVLDGSGSMVKGWFKDGDNWYYLNRDDGAMLSGQWIKDDGKDYYLSKSGIMARHSYIKDKNNDVYYWVDDDGVYLKMYDTICPDLKKYELVD